MSTLRFAQVSILWLAALVPPMAAQAQSTARPDLKIGDSWTVGISVNSGFGASTRREEVRVVREAGESGYQIEATPKGDGQAQTFSLSRDLNFISPTGAGGGPQEFKWLQWPLEPGRSYQFETMAGNSVATWKGKVSGWEEIEVPAGRFKALHVEFDRSGPFRYGATESVWFAPEAKAVVKRIQTRPGAERSRDIRTTELLSYKLN